MMRELWGLCVQKTYLLGEELLDELIPVGLKKLLSRRGFKGFGKAIALTKFAAEFAQKGLVIVGFNTFSNDAHAKAMG